MTISNNEFEALIQNNLHLYKKSDLESAKLISRALPKWRKSKTDWLIWWKTQDLRLRIEMQKFLFSLVRQEKLPINLYEKIHYELTPIQKSSKTIPVSLVESSGTPKFEGGIIEQEWKVCNYSFNKTTEKGTWVINYETKPEENSPTAELNLVLSALSFEIRHNQQIAKIGFIPHHFQESNHSETEAISGGMGPTVHTLPSIDLRHVEKIISISQTLVLTGLSVAELLRVRHRAITDSSNESNLITLWGAIEIELGNEEKSEKLLDEQEIKDIKKSLKQVISNKNKRQKLIDLVSKLKKKTKNDLIKERINQLNCAKGKNIETEVSKIFDMRGQLAHGKSIDESQKNELLREVTFLFSIVDEIIESKITEAQNKEIIS